MSAPARVSDRVFTLGWGWLAWRVPLGAVSEVVIERRNFGKGVGFAKCIEYRTGGRLDPRRIPGGMALGDGLLLQWLQEIRRAADLDVPTSD